MLASRCPPCLQGIGWWSVESQSASECISISNQESEFVVAVLARRSNSDVLMCQKTDSESTEKKKRKKRKKKQKF